MRLSHQPKANISLVECYSSIPPLPYSPWKIDIKETKIHRDITDRVGMPIGGRLPATKQRKRVELAFLSLSFVAYCACVALIQRHRQNACSNKY